LKAKKQGIAFHEFGKPCAIEPLRKPLVKSAKTFPSGCALGPLTKPKRMIKVPKQKTSPSTQASKAFAAAGYLGQTVGPGAVLCLRPRDVPLTAIDGH